MCIGIHAWHYIATAGVAVGFNRFHGAFLFILSCMLQHLCLVLDASCCPSYRDARLQIKVIQQLQK